MKSDIGEVEMTTDSAEQVDSVWPRRIVLPVLIIIVVVAITVCLYILGRNSNLMAVLGSLGYPGAFFISLIGNGTVLLPGVVLPLLAGLGALMYPTIGLLAPVLVGVVGGVGAAIGELVGYSAGYSGRRLLGKGKLYSRAEGWLRKWGTPAVFVFAVVPVFFDVVGLVAGALRFPLWKFVLVCWLGRTLMYVTILVLTALGWSVIMPYFG